MGLKDRVVAAKRYVWSPLTVEMVDKGSDAHVVAGQPARVVVVLVGEDDGTAERVTVELQQTGGGDTIAYPLGEAPVTPGRHELRVTMPTGLPPSAGGFTTYWLKSTLERRKGMASSTQCPVHVIARAEDCYWPAERNGREGAGALGVELDAETVAIGKTITGRVTGLAADERAEVTLVASLTSRLTSDAELQTKTMETGRDEVGSEPFAIEVPAGVVPTLQVGRETAVVWQVRATAGTTTAWTVVGVLDPDALAAVNEKQSSSLLELFT